MVQGGRVDAVTVRVATTTRLLADLLESAVAGPSVRRWEPGDDTALVCIVNQPGAPECESRVTIVVGDRLADPVTVVVDGVASSRAATPPSGLHALVLELTDQLSVEPV
jgi:hypothetical protein